MSDKPITLRDIFNHGKISRRKLFFFLQQLNWRIEALEHKDETFTVACTIKDKKGDAIGGASVELINFYDKTISFTGTTGSAGGCNISSVPYNVYHVKVTAEGYQEFFKKEFLTVHKAESLEIVLEE